MHTPGGVPGNGNYATSLWYSLHSLSLKKSKHTVLSHCPGVTLNGLITQEKEHLTKGKICAWQPQQIFSLLDRLTA